MSELYSEKNEAGEWEDVSLDELAGLDMTDVQAVRGAPVFPKGQYHFVVREHETRIVVVEDLDMGDKVKVPVITLTVEALDGELVDKAADMGDWVGKQHREQFWIRDKLTDTGRIKALMEDSGFTPTVEQLFPMLDEFIGHEFLAFVKNTVSKKDKDTIYANLDAKRVTPLEA